MNSFITLLLGLLIGVFPFKRITIVYSSEIAGLLQPQKATWINPDFPPLIGNAASLKTFVENLKDSLKRDGCQLFSLMRVGFWAETLWVEEQILKNQ